MELTFWTYEGPPHVGAIRVAASMRDVHLVLHSPQGDTYADLLFTMIERNGKRPPVTYTTFQARDLGGDTAGIVTDTLAAAVARFKPQVLLVADSCTAELIQDQPGTLAEGANLGVPVIALEMLAYSRKENWGASETFYSLVRGLLGSRAPAPGTAPEPRAPGRRPSVNLLGPTSLGFHCRDDVLELRRLLDSVGVDINVVAPAGASPADLLRLPAADANVCLYPETADLACTWLARTFRQPTIKTVPIGVGATRDFLTELVSCSFSFPFVLFVCLRALEARGRGPSYHLVYIPFDLLHLPPQHFHARLECDRAVLVRVRCCSSWGRRSTASFHRLCVFPRAIHALSLRPVGRLAPCAASCFACVCDVRRGP
ncbi:MAG: nitrogenase component 1, partial [Haliea sp.]